MAKPVKQGLSYFPLDTDLFGSRKIRRLPDTYGGEMLTFEKILPADSHTYTRARNNTG